VELEQLRMTRAAVQVLAPLRAPRPFTVTAPQPADAAGDGWFARLLPWTWRLSGVAAAACIVVAALSVYLAGYGAGAGPGQASGALSSADAGPARTDTAAEKAASGGAQTGSGQANVAQSTRQAAAPVAPAAAPADTSSRQAAATPAGTAEPARAQQDARDTFSRSGAAGEPGATATAPAPPLGGTGAPLPATAVAAGRREEPTAAAWRQVAPIWLGAAGLLGLISGVTFGLDRRWSGRS